MNDTETATKKTGPSFQNLEDRLEQYRAMIVVRSWLKSFDWPEFVSNFTFDTYGYVWVYPDGEFPEHFQTKMLKLLPFENGKLKREFRERVGQIYWVGEILVANLPENVSRQIGKAFRRVRLIFECGTKTSCKLIKKTREETYFELDCSSDARDEVAAGVQEPAKQ